mgnify:FL=1
MRHGTRQLSGKRARHGAGHRRVAGFYSAAWPDIAPPLTRIMARDFDRQDAEVQIRIALMNRFTSLGTPETVRMR